MVDVCIDGVDEWEELTAVDRDGNRRYYGSPETQIIAI